MLAAQKLLTDILYSAKVKRDFCYNEGTQYIQILKHEYLVVQRLIVYSLHLLYSLYHCVLRFVLLKSSLIKIN